uniref:Uncharacterized protein n=1 Tax=Siphoviridae sp. ctWT735 TaxID=2825538 RepID=A0A8S5TUC7_9CAUD|nr:MAG TPA: hypothetical protein [Siphoviridae sp. ctWT735]
MAFTISVKRRKYIRFEDNGLGSTVTKIGNIIEEKWLDLEEFFGKVVN